MFEVKSANLQGEIDYVQRRTAGKEKAFCGGDKMHRSDSKKRSEDLKHKLTGLQYHVTQENGTEPPFDNDYWNNEEEGLYVDIISGEPLFTSLDKFHSGCGWPSAPKRTR